MSGALVTSNAPVAFGKWKGTLLTRVPVSYLRWAITQQIEARQPLPDIRPVPRSVPFHEAAAAELQRRGERVFEVEISAHAVDRLSQSGLEVWQRQRGETTSGAPEGIYSFLERVLAEIVQTDDRVVWALREAEETGKPAQVETQYLGLKWVIQTDLALPFLLTVMPAKG